MDVPGLILNSPRKSTRDGQTAILWTQHRT